LPLSALCVVARITSWKVRAPAAVWDKLHVLAGKFQGRLKLAVREYEDQSNPSRGVWNEILALVSSSSKPALEAGMFFHDAIKIMRRTGQPAGMLLANGLSKLSAPDGYLHGLARDDHVLYSSALLHPGSGRTMEVRVLLAAIPPLDHAGNAPICSHRHSAM